MLDTKVGPFVISSGAMIVIIIALLLLTKYGLSKIITALLVIGGIAIVIFIIALVINAIRSY